MLFGFSKQALVINGIFFQSPVMFGKKLQVDQFPDVMKQGGRPQVFGVQLRLILAGQMLGAKGGKQRMALDLHKFIFIRAHQGIDNRKG
jgi:hypothetical protein